MLLYFLVNGVVWSMCCYNLYIKMISQKQIADNILSLYPVEELHALKEYPGATWPYKITKLKE